MTGRNRCALSAFCRRMWEGGLTEQRKTFRWMVKQGYLRPIWERDIWSTLHANPLDPIARLKEKWTSISPNVGAWLIDVLWHESKVQLGIQCNPSRSSGDVMFFVKEQRLELITGQGRKNKRIMRGTIPGYYGSAYPFNWASVMWINHLSYYLFRYSHLPFCRWWSEALSTHIYAEMRETQLYFYRIHIWYREQITSAIDRWSRGRYFTNIDDIGSV